MLNTSYAQSLGKEIYLYKNFISKEETVNLLNTAVSLDPLRWQDRGSQNYISDHVEEIRPLINKIRTLVSEDLILDDSCYFQLYKAGQGMGQHQDNNLVLDDIKKSKDYVEGEPYKTVKVPIYGIVFYLNESIGGELYYPAQNIEYRPYPGEMIIHSAEEHCAHEVKKVISDIRICIPTYIYKNVKVPLL